jgi:hypothetical protein
MADDTSPTEVERGKLTPIVVRTIVPASGPSPESVLRKFLDETGVPAPRRS